MSIHVVTAGQTLAEIGARYGVEVSYLAGLNGLRAPYRLVVGQSLLVLTPTERYTVQPGDTLYSVSRRFGLSLRRLFQRNPQLGGRAELRPGQMLALQVAEQPTLGKREVFGYAYPNAREAVLRQILPNATDLMPFTYGIAETGDLLPLNDDRLIALAREYGVRPVLHISTITETGGFDAARAQTMLSDPAARARFIEEVARTMQQKGYRGVDVDFEYLEGAFAGDYVRFITELRERVNELGGEVIVALAPKTSTDQRGLLYEGHDYAALAAAADAVLLMTYEWGYSYSPPMAVAPLPNVRRVVEFALTQMPAEKIFLGFPNYGYDWTLPLQEGRRARVVGNEQAVELAVREGAEIEFDETAQTPFFRYTDDAGAEHEVWFEDPRSAQAKFNLVGEYGLRGVGFWNFMRPFSAGFALLSTMAQVAEF